MKPKKITIEYDNGSKTILDSDVEEWLELIAVLINIAIQHGIDMQDFHLREE